MYVNMLATKLCIIFISLSSINIINGSDVKGFDDTVLFRINWPGKTDLLDNPNVEPLLVTTANNEQYKCLVPQFQEKEKDSIETYNGPSGIQLLEQLFSKGSCSHRMESYWNYELCHGQHVRQYHEEREGKKVKLQEFFLGRMKKTDIHKLSEDLGGLESGPLPMKKVDGQMMPYLAINMSDGTLCDLNQKPRLTRVLYVCYPHGNHEVHSVKETSSCEYEVVVLSPFLCKHPKYRAQESGENVINCLPLEGTPKKPRKLLTMEAESMKLKNQKSDEKLQKVFAVFSVNRNPAGQNGEGRVQLEIHPVEVMVEPEEDTEQLSPPTTSPLDYSPVSSFLSGKNCLEGSSGWWKYKFCFGVRVDQYHLEKDGTRTVVHLGRFVRANHLEWLERNPHKRPKPQAVRQYISHFYSEGSPCDITGRPRQTEVKMKCLDNSATAGAVALYLIEPYTCEYTLVVESPLICSILARADDNGLVDMGPEETGSEEITVTTDKLDNTIANGDE